MKAKILGIGQRHSGTSKSSGKPYDLTTIYCTHPAKEIEGEQGEEVLFNHLSGIDFPEIHVGDIIHVSYDRRGYLEEFDVLEKSEKASQIGNLKITTAK